MSLYFLRPGPDHLHCFLWFDANATVCYLATFLRMEKMFSNHLCLTLGTSLFLFMLRKEVELFSGIKRNLTKYGSKFFFSCPGKRQHNNLLWRSKKGPVLSRVILCSSERQVFSWRSLSIFISLFFLGRK